MERDYPKQRTTLSRVRDTPSTREGTWDLNVYSRYQARHQVERGRLRLSSTGVIVSTTHIDAHLQAMSTPQVIKRRVWLARYSSRLERRGSMTPQPHHWGSCVSLLFLGIYTVAPSQLLLPKAQLYRPPRIPLSPLHQLPITLRSCQ